MQWEYRVEYFGIQDQPDDLEKFLNGDVGADGWELVTVVAYSDNAMGRAFFKRAVPELKSYMYCEGYDDTRI